jgi:shikimate dehydrogenase
LRELGLNGEYKLYPIPPLPEGACQLNELINNVRGNELHGLNVTIPHKQAVIPLLDELTPVARAIGAVNTIFRDKGKLIGDNTDAPGFLADLQRFMPTLFQSQENIPPSAMILGSGGGARAVVFALAQSGWKITIVPCRKEDEQQAQSLAADIQQFTISSLPDGSAIIAALPFDLSSFILHPSPDLIVNCTPLGMSPNLDTSPWPAEVPFPSGAVLYRITSFHGVGNARCTSGLIVRALDRDQATRRSHAQGCWIVTAHPPLSPHHRCRAGLNFNELKCANIRPAPTSGRRWGDGRQKTSLRGQRGWIYQWLNSYVGL